MASGLQYVELGKQLGLVDEELRKYVKKQMKDERDAAQNGRDVELAASQRGLEAARRRLEATKRKCEAELEFREHELKMRRLALDAKYRCGEKITRTAPDAVDPGCAHPMKVDRVCIQMPVNQRIGTKLHEVTEISKAAKQSAEAHAQFDQQGEELFQVRIENEVQLCDEEKSDSVTQATEQNDTIQTKTVGQDAELSQEQANMQLHTEEGSGIVASIQKTTEKSATSKTIVDVQDQELAQNRPSVEVQMLDERQSISSLQQILEQPSDLVLAPTSGSNVSISFIRVLSSVTTRRQIKQPMQSGGEFAESSFRDSKPCHFRGDFHKLLFEENLILKTGLCHKYSRPPHDNIPRPNYNASRTISVRLESIVAGAIVLSFFLSRRRCPLQSPLFYLKEIVTAC